MLSPNPQWFGTGFLWWNHISDQGSYITYAMFISSWSLPSYSHCCLLTQVSDQDLEVLYVEANTFMLASHLFWALWALIQVSLLRAMCFNIKKQEYLTFIFCCL